MYFKILHNFYVKEIIEYNFNDIAKCKYMCNNVRILYRGSPLPVLRAVCEQLQENNRTIRRIIKRARAKLDCNLDDSS